MRTPTISHDKIPRTYRELVALVMPRPLHDEVDYNNAIEILEAMAGFEMNGDQEDYFEAVSTFVEKYEAEKHDIKIRNLTTVDLLRYLMNEHGMNESDMGRLIGDRSLGHRILSGERQLSKTHIQKLSQHFAVNADLFLS